MVFYDAPLLNICQAATALEVGSALVVPFRKFDYHLQGNCDYNDYQLSPEQQEHDNYKNNQR